MNSSGIKRGLATAAITALAVTGIPALAGTANAIPLSAQGIGANAVDILTGVATGVSPKSDGTNTTISIAATGGTNVTSVQFQYQPNLGAAVNIGGPVARNADGLFTVEWDGNAGAGVTSLDLIAIPNTGIANTDTEATALVPSATAQTVELSTEGSRGVFQSPYTADASADYVSVSGTNSAPGGSVTVSPLFSGAPTGTAATVTPVEGGTTATFAGIVDINGYVYSADDAPNQLALRAETAVGATDDVEASTLYVQQITQVTAVADATNVPTGSNANITVTVLDQNGNPIPNVFVNYNTPDTAADADTDPQPSGVASVRTNALGKVVIARPAGTYTFFADQDAAAAGVQNPGEKASAPVVITEFGPVLSEVKIVNERSRANFDLDELSDADDFTIETLNQNGGLFNETLAGDDVQYRYIIDTSGPGATITTDWRAGTDIAPAGTYSIAGPTEADLANVLPGETVSLTVEARRPNVDGAGLRNATPVTVKAGESEISFANGNTASTPANGSYTSTGTLALADGSALANRKVTVVYAPTGDSALAPTAQQPAGVTVVGNTATLGTDATGKFSVVVTDPTVPANVPSVSETGTLTADGVQESFNPADTTPLQGNLGPDDSATPNAPANAAQTQTVTFSVNTPPANSKIVIDTETGARPGEVVASGLTVTSGVANTPVAGLAVTLTLDKGVFTDGTPDPAPAAGADTNEFKSLTDTITVTTDVNGRALFNTVIERDAGFDDDGMVKAIVTATAGAVTDTEDIDYDSANPLNGGEVQLVLSPAAEQDGPTDPAAVDQSVVFDVYTTDQFGNRVGGEPVTVSENKPGASVTNTLVFSDFDDSGDFSVTSDRAQIVTVSSSWTTATSKYSGAPLAPVAGTETLTDTADVAFEGIDFAASEFSISTSPEGTVPKGSAVTETVTVLDQNGNPAQGLSVQFARSGAGGNESVVRTTNASGKANYTFIASDSGTINIVAVVSDGEGQTETLTDSVVVAGGTTPPPPIQAVLGGNTKGEFDRLRVKAPAFAQGAAVRLYKVVNGRRIQVGNTRALNSNGVVIFSVVDRNGRKFTKYVAVVRKTASSQGDTTNPKSLR